MNKDQEEFNKTREKLFKLADKIGLRLTLTVKNKFQAGAKPLAKREPGEN
jgi:hypothetical protein